MVSSPIWPDRDRKQNEIINGDISRGQAGHWLQRRPKATGGDGRGSDWLESVQAREQSCLPLLGLSTVTGGRGQGKQIWSFPKAAKRARPSHVNKISFDTCFNVDEFLEDVILNTISLSQKTTEYMLMWSAEFYKLKVCGNPVSNKSVNINFFNSICSLWVCVTFW